MALCASCRTWFADCVSSLLYPRRSWQSGLIDRIAGSRTPFRLGGLSSQYNAEAAQDLGHLLRDLFSPAPNPTRTVKTSRRVKDLFEGRLWCWICSRLWCSFVLNSNEIPSFSDERLFAYLAQEECPGMAISMGLRPPSPLNSGRPSLSCFSDDDFIFSLNIDDDPSRWDEFSDDQRSALTFDGDGTRSCALKFADSAPEENEQRDLSATDEGDADEDAWPDEIDVEQLRDIQRLLKNCCETHPRCLGRTTHDAQRFPTRLLDLWHDEGSVRLIETTTEEREIRADYATLSHCWGRHKLKLLLKEDYEDFIAGNIPIESLSKTFRHAISLCRNLGIQYIWIDSLCIIQNSDTDWKREAPRMSDIYSNSYLCIAAAASTSGAMGLFRKRQTVAFDKICVSLPDGRCLTADIAILDTFWRSPLLSRGWCIQELTLAPRVLYMADLAIYWRCVEDKASDVDPATSDELEYLFRAVNIYDIDPSACDVQKLDVEWHLLTQVYSESDLTFDKDSYMALAGLASFFKGLYQEAGVKTRYVAGVFEHDLLLSLLWMKYSDRRVAKPLCSANIPSWSWLATGIGIDAGGLPIKAPQDEERLRELVTEVVDLKVEYEDPSLEFGDVKQSSLVLRGPTFFVKRKSRLQKAAYFFNFFARCVFTGSWSTFKDHMNFLREEPRHAVDAAAFSSLTFCRVDGLEVYSEGPWKFFRSEGWVDDEENFHFDATLKCIFICHVDHPTNVRPGSEKAYALILRETTPSEDGIRMYKRCGLVYVRYPLMDYPKEPGDLCYQRRVDEAANFFSNDKFPIEELVLV